MKLKKKILVIAVLLIFCLIIHLYSNDENRVENGYSLGLFVHFSRFLRTIFGKIPFSIGDILYGLLFIWLIWSLVKFIKKAFKRQPGISKKGLYLNTLYRVFLFCSCAYIIFNLFWGINYDRKGIASQLGLEMKKYDPADLEKINELLVDKINYYKAAHITKNSGYPTNSGLYAGVTDAYKNIAVEYPFLKYQPESLKSSLWSWLGNYTGFTGYYNPFTGEAQLNIETPKFLEPFIACHEVGHQLGYAKEMEANFVGYLAASNSSDPLFQYSVYLEMFTYANRNLFVTDSTAAKDFRKKLSEPVVADIKEWIKFSREHESFVEPIVSWVYGKYLQGNKQPKGVRSYDEVTTFLIAYYKKFGSI